MSFGRNPHVQQYYLNTGTPPPMRFLDIFDPIAVRDFRTLSHDSAPRKPYARRQGQPKTVVHWGQRKLLLAEMEFLTETLPDLETPYTVVYAGAAPGSHDLYLSQLFPNVEFHLHDPTPFARELRSSPRFFLHEEFFVDSTALEYSNRERYPHVLFLSDIRSACPSIQGSSEVEQFVARDMDWQRGWVELMKPEAAMLKFRLPWEDRTEQYLCGDIFLPTFGPATTTEARLIVRKKGDDTLNGQKAATPFPTRNYDCKLYEDQMFYHNTEARAYIYHTALPIALERSGGLDGCFDCTSEIVILAQYLLKFHPEEFDAGHGEALRPESLAVLAERVEGLSRDISAALDRKRTLLDGPMEEREVDERRKRLLRPERLRGYAYGGDVNKRLRGRAGTPSQAQ